MQQASAKLQRCGESHDEFLLHGSNRLQRQSDPWPLSIRFIDFEGVHPVTGRCSQQANFCRGCVLPLTNRDTEKQKSESYAQRRLKIFGFDDGQSSTQSIVFLSLSRL